MATQTQTLRKPALLPERPHSYLYDSLHQVSSERDHARATFKAHTSTDRVKKVPHFDTMFSALRHHPRFAVRLDITDPVPKFISRQWRGYADQQREAIIRDATFNYRPDLKIPPKDIGDQQVSGPNRYRYFRRPIIPFMQQVPPDVLLASARQDPLAGAGGVDQKGIVDRPPTPATKTMETQTDYRESETQTDPYTPEYVVQPGSQPELLTLATLSYGRGLPAGLAEVEMIERARAKRAWEATLPPLSDLNQLDKRRRMMDDMEKKEWALREREIEKLQEARLQVLKKLLKQREDHHHELNTKRLDKLWAKKQEEKENKISQIRNEHIRTIRRLTENRRKVEGKFERREIVKDYSDYGSQVYAPMTRIGVFLDRGSEQFVVKSQYLNTYQGLLELENSLPSYVTAPRIQAPRPKTVTKSGFVKRKYRQQKELAEIHQVIKENKDKVEEPPKPLRFLQKIEKPIPRPPTPRVDVPSEDEEERELAVIFLQQVIRGRAIQNMMFEGKEKRIELIHELRSTHALQEAEQQLKKQEKQATLALQRQRRLHEHKESYVDESLSHLEGSSLGDTLDFLSKELIRLQEERSVHAYSMLAERQRRIREAEESGRRQVEERRRREEDEIFKQMVKVHQDSVDTYLEDIILMSIDKTADHQARLEIQETSKKINQIAYDLEKTRTQLQSEEIVSELVHGFLLPEVRKESHREKVKIQQRKHLYAAHNEIYGMGERVIDMHPKSNAGVALPPIPSSPHHSPTPPHQPPMPKPGSPTDRPPSGRSTPKSLTPSRPTSATLKDKAPSRPSSGKERTPSRPPSGTPKEKVPSRPSSGKERTPSRPPSGTPKEKVPSRPSSGKEKTPSRPPSGTSKEKVPSRPSSGKERTPSRPPSGNSKEKVPSRPSSRSEKPSRPPSGEKDKSSRPGSGRRGSVSSVKSAGKTESGPLELAVTGSASPVQKPASQPGSKAGSRSGSRPASRAEQKTGPEAQTSRPGSAASNK